MSQATTSSPFNALCRCVLQITPNKRLNSNLAKINYCIAQEIGSLGITCRNEQINYFINFTECTNYYSQNCNINQQNTDHTNAALIGVIAGLGAVILFRCYKLVNDDSNRSVCEKLKDTLAETMRIIPRIIAVLCKLISIICECIYNLLAYPYDFMKELCGTSNQPPARLERAPAPDQIVIPAPVLPNPRVAAQNPPVAPNRRIDNPHANSFNFELGNLETLSEQKECTICLTPFAEAGYGAITTLPCLHVFHKECVDPWLALNRNCPVCRDDTIPSTPEHDLEMALFPSQI